MSVTSRQIQVRDWRDELRDLTENLAQVQARIEQLETIQPENIWVENESESELAPCLIIPPLGRHLSLTVCRSWALTPPKSNSSCTSMTG